MSLASFDRAFARYFTMTHLYNAGETAGVLEGYRNGLSKLVNSLSWGIEVINPQPIDPQQQSSTSTSDTTNGMSTTAGRR